MDRYDDLDSSMPVDEFDREEKQLRADLQAYAQAHVRKVDGIRAYLKHCELMIDGARREIATQKANEEAWEARRDRLKALCIDVMTTFRTEELQGRTGSIKLRLDGETGSFLLKGNGGKQPVRIDNSELVPDEFCVYEGAIPAFIWPELTRVIYEHGSTELHRDVQGLRLVRTPRKSLIEAELQKPCETCAG